MSELTFLKALREKLKGGNIRSIHLNALPGRYATRLDLAQLNIINTDTARFFLDQLLSRGSFEFIINFDDIDLNQATTEEQKMLGLLTKRLNSLHFENDDFFKEHGSKTFGFGYPLLIKRSKKDPNKVIKAPLFLWALDIVKSSNKVNTWSIIRNKVREQNGKLVEAYVHTVSVNKVLASSIQSDENVKIYDISDELLGDEVLDETELLQISLDILQSLNSAANITLSQLADKLNAEIQSIPDAKHFETITGNSNPWLFFGGVFGLFRSQKESIITDIDHMIERFDEFEFEDLKIDTFSGTSLSAINTDPSQQEILNSLASEPNKIIQGPPGTGKSQSLTALITNALSNGLKCLVVCEKKTALDVIKTNLIKESEHLGHLVAIIEDITEDRDAIINSVRDRLSSSLYHSYNLNDHFAALNKQLEHSIKKLNQEHKSLDTKLFANKTWTQLVGLYLSKSRDSDFGSLKKTLSNQDFTFDASGSELTRMLAVISRGFMLYKSVNILDHPLQILGDSVFTGPNIRAAEIIAEQECNYIDETLSAIKGNLSELKHAHLSMSRYRSRDVPVIVQELYDNLIPSLQDLSLTILQLPKLLDIEVRLAGFRTRIEELEQQGRYLKSQYSEWLLSHYNKYSISLLGIISEYLNFASDGHKRFGKRFYRNTRLAKFKVDVMAAMIPSFKSLKRQRAKLLEYFEEIKEVHSRYSYFHHEYCAVLPLSTLEDLVQNIYSLQSAADNWSKTIPEIIHAFARDVSPRNLHPEYNKNQADFDRYSIIVNDFVKTLADDRLLIHPGQGLIRIDDCLAFCQEMKGVLEVTLHCIHEFKKDFSTLKESVIASFREYNILTEKINDANFFAEKLLLPANLGVLLDSCENIQLKNQQALLHFHDFVRYAEWRQFASSCSALELKVLFTLFQFSPDNAVRMFESWYYYWILAEHEKEFQAFTVDRSLVDEIVKGKSDFGKQQLLQILNKWSLQQSRAKENFLVRNLSPVSLYNKRGSRGERRNSLRKIIATDFSFFTSFFPVVMVSPSVCSSIIPLQEGLFDLVIFDEASQLRLEDTIPSLLRGKYKIVSGDTQQMPPSSYFQGGGTLLFPDEEQEEINEESGNLDAAEIKMQAFNLADSESLLVYAETKNYKQSFLKVHYRSQHPDLIEFSNHAFYGKRLIPLPPKKQYTSIQFLNVGGVYEEQGNITEAKQVVNILLNHIKPLSTGSMPSVGVATFNLYQRNLILEEIIKARQSKPEYDQHINSLGPDFFVKNLENIQGDERDIMIISTTFGKRSDGSFRQNFGPIIQKNGYKLLNVIVTRSKFKTYVVTSIPAQFIDQWDTLIKQNRNTGRAVFFAYLAYAKAVDEGNVKVKESILNLLYENSDFKFFELEYDSIGSESPFEDEVYYRISERIEQRRIDQQFRIGGFRIDMIIRSKYNNEPIVAIECDGAKYHSSNEADAWDIFRQKQIEQFGLKFHRIWSTDWWLNPNKEIDKLINFINDVDIEASPETHVQEPHLFLYNAIESVSTEKHLPVVNLDSIVTVRLDGKKTLKVRFSSPNNKSNSVDKKGRVLIPSSSDMARSLIGCVEGAVVRIGLLDNYYEILHIE